MKILILNGDDFGLNESVNKGVYDAYQSGMLRSVSLLVNAAATTKAASIVSILPNLEVGLHINFSQGKSISNPKDLPNLVDESGTFFLSKLHPSEFGRFLNEKIISTPSIIEEMKVEFKAQATLFKTLGFKLSHINFHHYIHLFHIEVFKFYVECAEESHVPFRGVTYPIIDKLNHPIQKIEQMKSMCNNSKEFYPIASISNLTEFERHPPFNYNLQMFQEIKNFLENALTESIEVIVHPVAEITQKSQRDSYYLIRRQESLLLNDTVFREKLENLGCRFAGYSSLWK